MMHAAARRPEVAAIGTPAPGWVLPPARYNPGIELRELGRVKDARQPWLAGPYKAPPVPGNKRAKSWGVVVTHPCSQWIASP
jgi:hypothetical protein